MAEGVLLQEEVLRAFFIAIMLLTVANVPAFADASVAGRWRANLGSGVTIDMNVTADGHWNSETAQRGKAVRQIRGTYTQEPSSDGAGTLVFTPTRSTGPKGSVQVETDQYEIAEAGNRR
jgi:hypothetical protein